MTDPLIRVIRPGRAYLDLGAARYHLQAASGGVLVSGGLLRQAVEIDDLLGVIMALGEASDALLEQSARVGDPGGDREDRALFLAQREPRPTAPCPRCGEVSSDAYSAQVCSLCGHGWRSAPDDDADDHAEPAGGAR